MDPKIETAGVTAYEAPPDTSFRRVPGARTSPAPAHARLNDPEIAILGAGSKPAPPPANQTPGEKYPLLP